ATLLATGLLAWVALGTGVGATASGWAATGSLAGLGSGRIWQVAFDPANPALAAAATDAGVYLSIDSGESWTLSALRGVGVWTVAFDASTSPSTLYAGLQGTGGIRVSSDGGATWANDSSGLPNRDVRCIVASPAGLAAGTDDGVALSQSGSSWYPSGLTGDSVSALAVVSNPPSAVFFAGIDYPSTRSGYLFELSSSAGTRWSAVTSGLPGGAVVNEIAAGPPSPATGANPILVLTSKGAYRSADGGKTWTASSGLPSGDTLTDATFSPLDPDLVYAGDDAGGSSGGGLWRSTDGGQTFNGFTQGLPTGHPSGEAPLQEVESLAVADGAPYPTVLAVVDPYQESATIYRQVDATAPSPPALATASGSVVTLPASAPPTHGGAKAGPQVPRPKPTPAAPTPLAAQVAGAVFHFPAPLLFEILLVLLAVFIWYRWKRHYYVSGPP
ncbi:MAG: hypothetical protein WCB85_06375, partial [Candidatus Dormiibacterota bacterium]